MNEKKPEQDERPDLPTSGLPDEKQRRNALDKQADRGSHGMTGGTERPAGRELER